MYSKSKLAVLTLSGLVVFYAALVMFYGNVVAQGGGAYKEISVFVDVLNKISAEYVDAPDMQKVMAGAMKGMVESLDAYGGYFQKAQIDEIDKRLRELKGDIGVVISKRPELVYVVSLVSGSPAEKAGIRPGDYIVSVDNASTFSQHLREVESELRGQPGSTVVVGVLRGSQAEPVEIKVTREEIRIPEIRQQIMGNDVGYLRPYFLNATSSEQFRAKLKTLQAAGATRILLDLRYVAGGDFDQAVEIANCFIKDGSLGYTQGKETSRKDFTANPSKAICDLPMVVLLNSASSGAAEVIAGALKDRGRGQIIGEKSFGYGSRQDRVALTDGSILLLTTERYFTPSGKAIQAEAAKVAGIAPDLVVPDEKFKSDLFLKNYLENRSDDSGQNFKQMMEKIDTLQLEKALETLRGLKAPQQKAA